MELRREKFSQRERENRSGLKKKEIEFIERDVWYYIEINLVYVCVCVCVRERERERERERDLALKLW